MNTAIPRRRRRTVGKSKAQEINQHQAEAGLEKLGMVVSWGIEGVSVDLETLSDMYDAEDLDKVWFPSPLTGSACFRKAIKEVNRSSSAKGFMIRAITENDQQIVYGIVKEDKDEAAQDLNYACEAKVEFQKTTESVLSFGRPGIVAHELAEAIKTAYVTLTETYISADIQRMLRRNIITKMFGIPMRRGGGSYFVAPQYEETITKLTNVVEQLGGSEVSVLILHRMPVNVGNIGRNAQHHLEDKLREVKAEVDKFKASPPTAGTLARRIENFKEMKSRVDMYTELLGLQTSNLQQGIDDCSSIVQTIIDGGDVKKVTRKKKTKDPTVVEEDTLTKHPKRRRRKPVSHSSALNSSVLSALPELVRQETEAQGEDATPPPRRRRRKPKAA